MNQSPVLSVPVSSVATQRSSKQAVLSGKHGVDTGDSGSSSDQSKYQMVALDLDGTLLQTNHQVADIQAKHLRYLYQKGMTVCIATGRAAPSVYEHVKKLNIPAPIPVVCSNGARGFKIRSDTMEKEELFHHPVSRSIVEKTLEIAEANSFAVQYYHEDSIYVSSNKPEHLRLTNLYSELTGSTIVPVSDNFKSMLDKDQLPSKLLVLFDEKKMNVATKLYQEEFSNCNKTKQETASIVLGAFDWFLEVLNPVVTKGFGLQSMCNQLQIPIAECIAMGDGANDLEFLEMAGLGLAMKNAREIVKKSANRSLEWTNDDHGVMKALQQLETEGWLMLPGLKNCIENDKSEEGASAKKRKLMQVAENDEQRA